MIVNYQQNSIFKAKFNNFMFDNIIKFGDLVNKKEKVCEFKITQTERAIFQSKIESFLVSFDENGKSNLEDNINVFDIISGFIFKLDSPVNNFFLYNLNRFSPENMSNEIKDKINEIYVFDYICNKFLFVLAQTLADSKEYSKYFTNSLIVMESLNGYLILDDNGFTLITQTTITIVEGVLYEPFNIKNQIENFTNNLNVINSENYLHFYTRNTFVYKSDPTIDMFYYFYTINLMYSLKLYKPCVTMINYILNDLTEVQQAMKKPNKTRTLLAFCELYCFLTFIAVDIYITIGEYNIAINLLENISKFTDNQHNVMIYKVLTGICLSKIGFPDMSSIFFQHALKEVEKVLVSDEQTNDVNLMIRQKEELDLKKIPEGFIIPVKMLISSLNLKKVKAIEHFIFQTTENPVNKCYYCDITMNPNVEIYTCSKCKRAAYCSLKCLKKNRIQHEVICYKYFQFHEDVNDLVRLYS